VISERLFARSYASFWRDLLPFSEAFVRGVNAQWPKLEESVGDFSPLDRAMVNEAAVRLYRRAVSKSATAALKEAVAWLRCPEMEIEEWAVREVKEMSRRLRNRFGTQNVEFAPRFRGCGVLSPCEADLRIGARLIEVKAGYRNFRSVDFRQVLIYAALCDLERLMDMTEMTLINARLMREVSMSVEDLCGAMAGSSASDVLPRIVDFVSAGIASGL